MKNFKVSIVIVTYKTREVTLECLKSIYASNTKFSYEVIVVDNNSEDGTIEAIIKEYPQVLLIASDKNNGFSRGNNLGIRECKGDYILLLNSDTLLFENSMENLVESADIKGYKICGPKLLNKDQTIQRSWFNFPSAIKIFLRLTEIYTIFYRLSKFYSFRFFFFKLKPAFMLENIVENTKMNYLTFACVLIKKDVFDQIGLLDEGLTFYHEDCEFGIRANKVGLEIFYNIDSEIIHLGGTSSSGSSIFAFENDIIGLLHVYKKHYSLQKFKTLKRSIYLALTWRMFFWHFGFFRALNKIGIYDRMNKTELNDMENELYNKYRELRKLTKDFKYNKT